MKRLVVVDAHAVIHRAFHAMPPLTSPDGAPVNAVYGFASLMLKVLKELKPDYLVVAFDHPGPTFRHLAFERYKAHREKGPDELYQQIPVVEGLLDSMGVMRIDKEGYEADDLIGTVTDTIRKAHADMEVVIVSGDLDTLQLIDEKTKVFTLRKGVTDTLLYDENTVSERYGLRPDQMVDFKGLCGDPSDNIPGVKGVGEKTAKELLKVLGNIEGVYKALKENRLVAKPSILAALKAHEADALFSKTLATIDRNAPINFVLAKAKLRKLRGNEEKIRAAFQGLGFQSLIRRMEDNNLLQAGGESRSEMEAIRKVEVKEVKAIKGIKVKKNAVVTVSDDTLILSCGGDVVYKLRAMPQSEEEWLGWLGAGHRLYTFDLKNILNLGLPSNVKKVRDLMLFWWLIEPGRRSYQAEDLLKREYKHIQSEDPALITAYLYDLAPILEDRLEKEELAGIYEKIEGPLVPILRQMELAGIKLNPRPLAKLSIEMEENMDKLAEEIYDIAGSTFNINSSQQLSDVLFNKLKILTKGLRKTEKLGVISTRETELVKLRPASPIIDKVLSYRELAKIKSTYVDALPSLVGSDGRVHTTWNQTGTATGRLSSQDPNLQNIPVRGKYGSEIRKCFVAERGFKLAAFDYTQLELRIAADLANDEKMIKAFKEGRDIHALTATEVNRVDIKDVTPDMRRKAKTLNFGILYGMGAGALAEATGISRSEAELFIEEYFDKFRGIARFIQETKNFAHAHGFTKTAFGRKRYFPNISSTNFRMQREVERQALNHPIQGTGGDIMKKAMIDIREYLASEKVEGDVKMLLQIHDELVFEVKLGGDETVLAKIKNIMSEVWKGKVRMEVAVKAGASLGDLE